MRFNLPVATIVLLAPGLIFAAPTNSILTARAYAAYVDALQSLNMTPHDAGFDKDLARDQRFVLQRVRRMLRNPLDLTQLADEIRTLALQDEWTACWTEASRHLEVKCPVSRVPSERAIEIDSLQGLPPELTEFYSALATAAEIVTNAASGLSAGDKAYAAASFFGNMYLLEDKPSTRNIMRKFGFAEALLDEVIAENSIIDPEPIAIRFMDIAENISPAAFIEAAKLLTESVEKLASRMGEMSWPTNRIQIETAHGSIAIGTKGRDVYEEAYLAIIDPGGDDTYTGQAGVANGMAGSPVSVIVDRAGNDGYFGKDLLGPGSALFGVQVSLDMNGDDNYSADYSGQGAAAFGCALVDDLAGRDVYRAHAFAQGAGYRGVGILRDHKGNDLYDLGFAGQAYSGLSGIGFLFDRSGNDRYIAGGRRPDYDRNDKRYLSTAQGFSTGMRPFAGGGIAALVDLAGNDTYEADVYGQGVGYWYSVGILLDLAGEDTYQLYQYGQGSGIHLSLGLLSDEGGNDFYSGYVLSQGSAHDYAVGILADHAGTDTYTADHNAQGRAIHNAFALLLEYGGNDAYFARQSDLAQGIGNDGHFREYGSLAILLDLGGKDQYSCGAENGARMQRPDFGIVYDQVLP